MERVSGRGHWSSRLAFIIAAVGSAVGLGNIWKFPYMAGSSGGGAFVLLYFICLMLVALPMLIAELMLGKRGKQSPPHTMETLAIEEGRTRNWRFVGWLGLVTGFLILSFYSVVGGWTIAYIPKVASGVFTGMPADQITARFGAFLGDPVQVLLWHSVFMAVTVFFVARGINAGIEMANKVMMPSLFVLLALLVGYAMIEGDFLRGAAFLFAFDLSKINADVFLSALGQALFSVSCGIGAMMTYGSYLTEDVRIPNAAVIIVLASLLVAVLAGLAIFPIVFANGLDPAQGPGLVFAILPVAFSNMPGGSAVGTLFFVLLLFAAITSSISILEPLVAYAEERKGVKRIHAAIGFGLLCWFFGLATVFSFSLWQDVYPLAMFARFETATAFDLVDFATSNIGLPLGGLLIVIFAAWVVKEKTSRAELQIVRDGWYRLWHMLARYLAPASLIAIFIANLTG